MRCEKAGCRDGATHRPIAILHAKGFPPDTPTISIPFGAYLCLVHCVEVTPDTLFNDEMWEMVVRGIRDSGARADPDRDWIEIEVEPL